MHPHTSLLFCLLATFSGHAFCAPVDGSNGDCPGGLANGAILERGRFFYECRNGEIAPKGCVSDELKRIEIGGTVDKKYFRVQCLLGSDNLLTFDPVSCLFQNSEHKIGDTWEDGSNFYTCKKADNNELRSVNIGCLDSSGRRISLKEKITKDDFVYVCNETVNNGARLMPTACVKDGKEFNEGDQIEINKDWFTCTRVGREKLSVKPSGCVNNGRRLADGDRYTENDIIYECTIDGGKSGFRVTACSQRDERGETIERKLGCSWIEGTAPFQYEWLCQHDTAGNSAKKVQLRCNYNVGAGTYNIEPGCYRMDDKTALGCLNESSGLKLQSFQGDSAEQSAQAAGLRAC